MPRVACAFLVMLMRKLNRPIVAGLIIGFSLISLLPFSLFSVGVSATSRIGVKTADLNQDGIIDLSDAIILSSVFDTVPGDVDWNPDADLNNDGVVAICDAILLAQSIGESVILADVINGGLNSINWSRAGYVSRVCLTHLGAIFNKLPLSAYDADLQAQASSQNWVSVMEGLRFTDIDGYSSPVIRSVGEQALSNHPMAGTLPANYGSNFLVYYRNEVYGYRYAEEWDFQVNRWNKQTAFNEFAHFYDSSSSFVWSCNPASGSLVQDDRYYDGAAQTLGVFLKFYQIGVPGALEYADRVWNAINTRYNWCGYYPYHLINTSFSSECEIAFHSIVGEYANEKGGVIPYSERLLQDIDYKLLGRGWNSSLWTRTQPRGYTVSHIDGNSERRLSNTLNAFHVLHSYYQKFNGTMKENFVQLLTGSPKAWEGLLRCDLFKSGNHYRFKPDTKNTWDNPSLIDTGTAIGDLLLFLEGIVPSTGSLAVLPTDEIYEDVGSAFSARYFGFNYDARTIRIPVCAGELGFQFGSELVSHLFDQTATYEIEFSDDWNTVLRADPVGGVPTN